MAHLKPGQSLTDQLEYLDYVIANAPAGKFHNPTGFYVTFIQDNTPIPETFATAASFATSKFKNTIPEDLTMQPCNIRMKSTSQNKWRT